MMGQGAVVPSRSQSGGSGAGLEGTGLEQPLTERGVSIASAQVPPCNNDLNQTCSGRLLPQVRAEKGDRSIPRDPRLLRVEGSKEVFFVQEGVAGGIVVDLRLSADRR